MDSYKNKFLYIAEMAFYIMYLSFLVTLTGVLIFTIGTAITSAYYVVKVLKEKHDSMTVRELTICYFKEFIKKIVPTTMVTLWFIITAIAIFNIQKSTDINIITLAIVIFVCIEMSLLFQIIFYVFAMNDNIRYVDAISKALILAHRYLFIMLLACFMAIVLAITVGLFRWTVILAPGLQIYITQRIFSSKEMEKSITKMNI